MTKAAQTSRYSRYLVPLAKPFANFDVPFIGAFRRRAIARLSLREGERVLDVGCGSGGSFRLLHEAVGDRGEVVGIELSPQVAALAQRRVDANHWKGVTVIEGAAQTAPLQGAFDGAIMFGANEIFTLPDALANIFSHLKPGARVVVMGAKLAERGLATRLNPLFRRMTSTLMLPSTPTLDLKPYALLQERLRDFHVEEVARGLLFLMWGSVKAEAKTASEFSAT